MVLAERRIVSAAQARAINPSQHGVYEDAGASRYPKLGPASLVCICCLNMMQHLSAVEPSARRSGSAEGCARADLLERVPGVLLVARQRQADKPVHGCALLRQSARAELAAAPHGECWPASSPKESISN